MAMTPTTRIRKRWHLAILSQETSNFALRSSSLSSKASASITATKDLLARRLRDVHRQEGCDDVSPGPAMLSGVVDSSGYSCGSSRAAETVHLLAVLLRPWAPSRWAVSPATAGLGIAAGEIARPDHADPSTVAATFPMDGSARASS